MQKLVALFLVLASFSLVTCTQAQNTTEAQRYQQVADTLFKTALTEGQAYDYLRYLCKTIGPRLSGSPSAAAAVEYTRQIMDSMGLDKVYLEEVMVPHWVRGKQEKGYIVGGEQLSVTALGGSVGTGPEGRRAQVIEVKSLREVEQLGKEKIKGKIVFYNRPMDPTHWNTFKAYGGAADQRGLGPSVAARFGAVAVLVRSLSGSINDYPHTGATKYQAMVPKIPAFGLSTLDAEMLSVRLKTNPDLEVFLESHCQTLPDVKSYNVIGELRGTEKPDEIVTIGGHLDSWDLGDGAQDDGAGCVQSLEAIRLLKHLGLRPKRTIRVVMFMNEENGLRGGIKYAENVQANKEKVFAAIEADMGASAPRSFDCSGDEKQRAFLQRFLPALTPWGVTAITEGGGGADISPLASYGTVRMGLWPETQRYFDYHHSDNDRFETVNARELHLGTAALAAMAYFIAEYGLPDVKLKR